MGSQFSLRDTIQSCDKSGGTGVVGAIEAHLTEISQRLKIADINVERSSVEPHTLQVNQWVKVQAILRNDEFKGIRVAAPEDMELRVIPYKGPRLPGKAFNYGEVISKVKEYVLKTKDYSPPPPKVKKSKKVTPPTEKLQPAEAARLLERINAPVVESPPPVVSIAIPPTTTIAVPQTEQAQPTAAAPSLNDEFLPPGLSVVRRGDGSYCLGFSAETPNGKTVAKIVDALKRILAEA